jgi:hypothetical protein
MGKIRINIVRACASFFAAEIIWSVGAGDNSESNLLFNNNFINPEQHFEEFFYPDSTALNFETKATNASGVENSLIFNL